MATSPSKAQVLARVGVTTEHHQPEGGEIAPGEMQDEDTRVGHRLEQAIAAGTVREPNRAERLYPRPDKARTSGITGAEEISKNRE